MPGNPVDRGAWWATIHRVAKESDKTEHLNNNHKERDTPRQRFCLCGGHCAHSGTSRVWAVTNFGEEINYTFLEVKSQKLNFVFKHWNLSKVLGVKMAFEISHTWSSTIILFLVSKRIRQHFITLYSKLTEKNIELICFQRAFVKKKQKTKTNEKIPWCSYQMVIMKVCQNVFPIYAVLICYGLFTQACLITLKWSN